MVGKIPRCVRLKEEGRYQRLVDRDRGTPGIKAGHVILKKGEDIGQHTTGDREEIVVVLKGKGRLEAGGDTSIEFEKGCLLYVPSFTTHNIFNAGLEELEYVFITAKGEG